MPFPRKLKELCTPSFIYFSISMIGLISVILQNLTNNNTLILGSFNANVPNTTVVFIVKFIYILFWTWILNLICKDGHREIAWFLLLVPFILTAILAGLFMVSN